MPGRDSVRFAIGEWTEDARGTPLLQGAAASFDCAVAATLDQFSHSIFIGDVMNASAGIGRNALVCGARRFRTLRKIMPTAVPAEMEALHS